ncbi:MAG: serpin family protein [Anaerolineaceae bacterium]
MKTKNIALILTLIIAMLISACQPLANPPSPTPTQQPTEEIVNPTPAESVVNDKIGVIKSDKSLITNPSVSADDLQRLAEAENIFMINLYKQIAADEENVIFSPYSLYQALLMAYIGAEGETARQMAEVLQLPLKGDFNHLVMNKLNQLLTDPTTSDLKNKFVFTSANAVWGQYDYGFRQSYLDQLAEYYGSGLRAVDFAQSEASRAMINDWVSEQTQQKIKELIPQGVLDAATRMVLTNAVYFKAGWMRQFEDSETEMDSFHLLDGSEIDVEMMNIHKRFSYQVTDNYTAIELPYEGGKFSMVVFMPNEGTLNQFEQALDLSLLSNLTGKFGKGKVILSFPKFKIESQLDLGQVLSDMGMVDAFDPALADFSKMTDAKDLMITNVLQKAMVDVDEKGTEAAAATAVVVGVTSAPVEEEPQVIKIDHPFLFFIRDVETNTTLFMGRMINPES